MSLTDDIRNAQIRAGEEVVINNLREKGFIPKKEAKIVPLFKPIDFKAIIEDIEFAKVVCAGHIGGLMNPTYGISLENLYPILAKHIPNFEKAIINGENT